MNSFKIQVLVIIILLIIINIVGIIVNQSQSFSIDTIDLHGSTKNADFSNQVISVNFNSPILSDNIASLVKIEPEVKTVFNVVNNSLKIRFVDNLEPETSYKISISGEIENKVGKKLSTDRNFEFTTKALNLTFLQIDKNGADKIIQSDYKFDNQNILFEHPTIIDYSRNEDYLAVIVENEEGSNDIFYLDLKKSKRENLNLKFKAVTSISMSKDSPQFVYTFYGVQENQGFMLPYELGQIEIFDIEKKSKEAILLNNVVADLGDVRFSPDSKSIIFQDEYKDEYFILALSKKDNLISLGNYLELGGMNKTNNKLIFTGYISNGEIVNKSFIAELNSSKIEKTISNLDFASIGAVYFNNSDNIVFSQSYGKHLDRDLFELHLFDSSGQSTLIIGEQNSSIENVQISSNDRYIVAEKFSKESLVDYSDQFVYGFISRPKISDLIVIDLQTKEIISTQKGVNPIWNNW